MAVESLGDAKQRDGVAFLVSAGIVFEIIAAACSSPQTTELNAKARSKTLMKWVGLGIAGSAIFVAGACYFEPASTKPFIVGGGLAGGLMAAGYAHAKKAGLASTDSPTESY